MGYFLAVSAFRTDDTDAVCRAIVGYCMANGVGCGVEASPGHANEATDAVVYAPVDGWTCVLWPAYFNIHDFPLCETLSKDQGLAVSTVHVYDGDFWEHLFLDQGRALHRFSSWPDCFAENPEEAAKAKAEWQGEPSQLACFLGIDPASISRYLVHLPLPPPVPTAPPLRKPWPLSWFCRKEEPASPPVPPKAYGSDAFAIEDFWVFTDFWAKLGIRYPDPPDQNIACVLRMDSSFTRKLPTI